jgi:hypothetical protein
MFELDPQHESRVKRLKKYLGQDRESGASTINAKANLLNAERLAHVHEDMHKVGEAAAKLENKLPKTAEALGHLGMGKGYGE